MNYRRTASKRPRISPVEPLSPGLDALTRSAFEDLLTERPFLHACHKLTDPVPTTRVAGVNLMLESLLNGPGDPRSRQLELQMLLSALDHDISSAVAEQTPSAIDQLRERFCPPKSPFEKIFDTISRHAIFDFGVLVAFEGQSESNPAIWAEDAPGKVPAKLASHARQIAWFDYYADQLISRKVSADAWIKFMHAAELFLKSAPRSETSIRRLRSLVTRKVDAVALDLVIAANRNHEYTAARVYVELGHSVGVTTATRSRAVQSTTPPPAK